MINHDAALAYLDYYGEEAMGISIVSPRVRPACKRSASLVQHWRLRRTHLSCPQPG
jgi:hypothetical protein